MCRPTHESSSVQNPNSSVEEPAEAASLCLLTCQGKKILAKHQATIGQPLFHETSTDQVSEGPTPAFSAPTSPTPQDRHQAKRQRRKEAQTRGHRLLTVCGRWRNGGKIPDLRMTGRWLEKAGFGLGQEVEVEVEEGRLTILVV